jgi:cytochrome c551/c552
MKVLPSAVAGVAILGPDSEEFEAALVGLLGRAPRELLKPALPFSVIVENLSNRGIALLGVRFDMLGPKGKHYSVVHYSDTLRNPGKGDLRPGARRFVCAEPEYTTLVLNGGSAAQTRGRMNLENLRRMLSVAACVDCVAFDDGQFVGPDSQKAFERFAGERETERDFVEEALARAGEPLVALENWLCAALQDEGERARRLVARRLLEGLDAGGAEEMAVRARGHRLRLGLWR